MRRLLVPLVAMTALLVASCGDSGTSAVRPPAATVNGAEIREPDLLAHLEAAATVPGYAAVFGLQGSVAGTSPGTYDAGATAEVLTTLILFELFEEELEARDLEIGEEQLARAEQFLAGALAGSSFDDPTGQPAPGQGEARLDAIPESTRDQVLRGVAASEVLAEDLSGDVEIAQVEDADVRSFFDDNPDFFDVEESCVRYILLLDEEAGGDEDAEEAAESVRQRLEAGESFEDLALELAEDEPGAPEDGDLGCVAEGAFPPEIDEVVWGLEVGDVSEPFEAPEGIYLFEVYERAVPTFESVSDDIRLQLESQAEAEAQAESQADLEAWFSEVVLAAEVTVDPRYGTWEYFAVDPAVGEVPVEDPADAVFARVVPPEGPTPEAGGGESEIFDLSELLGEEPIFVEPEE